ncbi:MAG: glutaredoxin family protein [Patescibacteria group bacterium]
MSVTIYTIQDNIYCRMAKKYFDEKKITYNEYDIISDIQKAVEMEKKAKFVGVPVILIGRKTIIGFDKKRLDKILD